MRFDLRGPGRSAEQRADLHRTAIDMAAWADDNACTSIVVSEHHTSDDGYLPSPIPMAAAMAAVTTTTPIAVAAAILPFYDPVRLAEDIITLDHISRGRAMVVLGIGYRPDEYRLHGVDFDRRGAIADEKLERLLALLDDAGRATDATEAADAVRVTPGPYTSPRPLLAWGGQSRAAARRAGRHGLHFLAQGGPPDLGDVYAEAARAHGHEAGMCVVPSVDAPLIVFVNDEVEAGWDEVGPSMLVDAIAYHDWNEAAGSAGTTASISSARTLDELRTAEGPHRVVTPETAAELVRAHGPLGLHPLCGGLDPEVAWPYLRRAVAAANGALG